MSEPTSELTYDELLAVGRAQLDEAMRQARELSTLRASCNGSEWCRSEFHHPICLRLAHDDEG